MHFTGSGKEVCHANEPSVERSKVSVLSSRVSFRENLSVSSKARYIFQNFLLKFKMLCL